MRRLLALLLLVAFPLAGQLQIDSSQMKLKTNGGLTAGADNALTAIAYRSTTSPASPISGQLWCDTNTTPCTLKQYNGSTWGAPQVNAAIRVVSAWKDLPGSPTDGMMVYVRSLGEIAFYDSTAATWTRTYIQTKERFAGDPSNGAGATVAQDSTTVNVFDVYTAAVITKPGAATATNSATAGSLGAGTYSWKITFRNATGGETDGGTVSNTITPGLNKSADLSSIPTGGSGTTQRNVYRTKSGAAGTGPWYFVGNIADNTTTTYHDGLADASAVTLVPDINFSAPLPTGWTVSWLGAATTTTGGCGGTGASRATMACYAGANWWKDAGGVVPVDGGVHAFRDLSAFVGSSQVPTAYGLGAITVSYRVKLQSQNGDTYATVCNPTYGGGRLGTGASMHRIQFHAGAYSCGFQTPPSSSNHPRFYQVNRSCVGCNVTTELATSNPFPQIDAYPFYVKWFRSNSMSASQFQVSADGVNYAPDGVYTGTSNYNYIMTPAGAGWLWPALTTFDLAVTTGDTSSSYTSGPWIEIDSFQIIVR